MVDSCIGKWLLLAIDQALPPEVISIFFTALRGSDSHLETDVPLILGKNATSIAVGRFAWMVRYNIEHSASLLQNLHRSPGKIGRSAMVLSSQPQPPSLDPPPRSGLAWVSFSGDSQAATPLDSIDLPPAKRTISIRDYVDAAIGRESPSIQIIPVNANGSFSESESSETPLHLEKVVRDGVLSEQAELYRSHAWPLMRVAQVLMVMAPAYETDRERRLDLGSSGLNLLIDPTATITTALIETALGLIRTLDSLFGTVQHLHRAQLRDRLSYEAMNTIAHSFKNRADRLSTAYPDCARDLYIQKLSCTGAGQVATSPAFVFSSGRPALWKKAGFREESLTEGLRTTIWRSKPHLHLDLDLLENRSADARWVALLEELMANLSKWNAKTSAGSINLTIGEISNSVNLVVTGTVWPEQWHGIAIKLQSMSDNDLSLEFKGLNAVMAMIHKLRTGNTTIDYFCGTGSVNQVPHECNTYSVYDLAVSMTRFCDYPKGSVLPLSFTVMNLQVPSLNQT